jgi:FtsH-binding integral membrane protein
MITPDLKQNIALTVYLTIADNVSAVFFACGIALSAFVALRKPSRHAIFFLLGFILLLFGFEYKKHILDGLRDQTINALITTQEHYTVRRIVNIVLVKLAPILFPFVGWVFVITGGYLYRKSKIKR